MDNIKKHFSMLGYNAMDKVTKVEGIITSISFDLFGCIQVVLTPPHDSQVTPRWYDIRRIKILDNERVMDCPNFDEGYIAEGKKGADSYKSIP